MSRRKVWIIAGVLVVAGAAASIAAVGDRQGWHRDGRFGHRGMMGGDGMGGDERGDRGGWRGFFQRSVSQEDFDARTRERFARFDKNSDGVIDASEIEGGITERMGRRGERMGEMMLRRLLARFDTNHDGKISRDEFLGRVKKEFARADLNNDGRITDDDLPPMMRGRDALKGGMRGGRGGPGGFGGGDMLLGRMIQADGNKDGVITLDEALATAGKRFDQFDRNKDGAIDKADLDAMRKDMQAYQVQRFLHDHGADKDGKVSREQFFNAAKERFAERDVNRDGRIDRRDLGAGTERGMGERGGPGRERGERGGRDRDGGPERGPDRGPERGNDRGPGR